MHIRPGMRRGKDDRSGRGLVPMIGLALVLAGCATGTPSASESAGPSPSAEASMTAIASPSAASNAFSSQLFDIPISLVLDGGWVATDTTSTIDLLRSGSQDVGILDIASTTVPGTVSGPQLPWPKDLLAWLDSRPEFTPKAPRNITVGGRPAILIDADVAVPAGTDISMVCPGNFSCWLVDGKDSYWRFIEVRNADGSGIAIITNGAPGTSDAYLPALDRLLATLTFR